MLLKYGAVWDFDIPDFLTFWMIPHGDWARFNFHLSCDQIFHGRPSVVGFVERIPFVTSQSSPQNQPNQNYIHQTSPSKPTKQQSQHRKKTIQLCKDQPNETELPQPTRRAFHTKTHHQPFHRSSHQGQVYCLHQFVVFKIHPGRRNGGNNVQCLGTKKRNSNFKDESGWGEFSYVGFASYIIYI